MWLIPGTALLLLLAWSVLYDLRDVRRQRPRVDGTGTITVRQSKDEVLALPVTHDTSQRLSQAVL